MTNDPHAGNPGSRSRSGFGSALLVLILLLIAGTAAWSWLTLSWSYSEGERAGILQKFSRKGWLCKTDEGELALYIVPGVAPQIWEFTVRDPQVVADMYRSVGKRVQLHYTEHRGVPSSCFGETTYFVDRVIPVDTAPVLPVAPVASAPAAP